MRSRHLGILPITGYGLSIKHSCLLFAFRWGVGFGAVTWAAACKEMSAL
jgi:hypothetical protein